MSPARLSHHEAVNFSRVPHFSSALCLYTRSSWKVAVKVKTFLTNLYQIRNNTFFQPSVKAAACVTFHTASSAILKAFLEARMNQILWQCPKVFSLFLFFFFSFLSLLCFLPLLWWKGQYFLPIETPSVQREAPPCSPLLCYNLFLQAADNFCP